MQVLWSNRSGETLTDELIPCFPLVGSTAYSLDKMQMEFLTTELTPIYACILEGLTRAVAGVTDIDRESYRVILRESVVLTTYALVDRTLRLSKAISQRDLKKIGVGKWSDVSLPKTNAHFMGLVESSQEFNQYLLFRLASSIWQMQSVELSNPPLSDVKKFTATHNNNFDSPGLLVRLKRKISRKLSSRFGSIPALRLANIDSSLLDAGLFGINKLIWIEPKKLKILSERNVTWRKRVLPLLSKEIGAILSKELFLRVGGLQEEQASRAAEVFCELLLEMIPPDRLEGGGNYLKCEQHLSSLRAPAMLFCGTPSDDDIHWIAAARNLKIPVIGVQHGAHYGFSMQACHSELEYTYCDKFVTWGWSKFPNNEICRGIEAIPLPSPWLSERKKKWKKIEPVKNKQRMRRRYDVLWMTDRLHMFPPTLSTLRVSRLDHIETLNHQMFEVADRLARSGVRILHKPFNCTSAHVQSNLINTLKSMHPHQYAVYQRLDKGLTEALLEECSLVLWDEPGTGFFECLVGGVPTMVLWDRLISHEEAYAEDVFLALENTGLVHRIPESLESAVNNFLVSPRTWLSEPGRIDAISFAIERFSGVDSQWEIEWKKKLLMRH
jgi:putative transferase (TIGR04331 family)